MITHLHIDIETYSSEDLSSAGVYRYSESVDFEILMIAYAFDFQPVKIVDLASGEPWPEELVDAFNSPYVIIHAHNAAFERVCLSRLGFVIPLNRWRCSAVKASYCGLPRSLGEISKVLKLGEMGKDTAGDALIRYFSIPVKPTKTNGMRRRNFPQHDPDKWSAFKYYCTRDVVAEREIESRLAAYNLPEWEWALYALDQEINDRGVRLDMELVDAAIALDAANSADLHEQMIAITGLENPNSPAQLKGWLKEKIGYDGILDKDAVDTLLKGVIDTKVRRLLELRKMASRSAIKKYVAMRNCVCQDGRAHGLFLHYGASRTGRWSGRLIQLQNLFRNSLDTLDLARDLVRKRDADTLDMIYGDVSLVLAQLIRTALIPEDDRVFAVADFSAIEARVIAWLAGEQWRIEVFNTHGKIYEASASMMFHVPMDQIGKGSDLRQKGKIAELALGYQGAVGALKTMGGEKMGLSESEMKGIVARWRKANPNIVELWGGIETAAKKACMNHRVVYKIKFLSFEHDGYALKMTLPSGRQLFYKDAYVAKGTFSSEVIKYEGVDQETKKWGWLETYGGKLTENAVQAISRDLLGVSMMRLRAQRFPMVMHVHDEVVAETSGDSEVLEAMCELMGAPVDWAPGLPLRADGYITKYYKKD